MKCIVAVDDSTINLKFVEHVLKDTYHLVLLNSGKQALEYLEENDADLVLLDLLMPEMDGLETFEKIKKLERNSLVPVIFLTADTEAESEITCLQKGAVDFIRKPFIPEVMLNRIQRVLQLEDLNHYLEKKVKEKTVQVEQMSFETIATISSIIEARDSYTKGHSVRVAEYSALIGERAGWTEDAIRNLKYIALLHDIGKVGIPDNVLNKPGKLTEEEFNIIKSHTTIGGEILKEIETINEVSSGAMYHHERYDGRGYPSGLSGDEIPAVARIICIADAYDAMNSKRVYRDSLSPEVIRAELQNGRGTQFDPHFLDIFFQLLDEEKVKIKNNTGLGERKTLSGESTELMNRIIRSMEEETRRREAPDFLTGLLNRKVGEGKIINAMKELPGCLAFLDLDNLKTTNDTMGHLAGDFALKTVGEVLTKHGENAICTRIGGDEFLFYMIGVNQGEAAKIVEAVIASFQERKEQEIMLSASSLSVGLCVCTPADVYEDVLQKADKALYHMKQSGKCGYFFHQNDSTQLVRNNSVDLKKLVGNLSDQGAYNGSLSLSYRAFAKIYDFIRHLGERYGYSMQLILITMEIRDFESVTIDEREYAMSLLEKTIQDSLRSVDVSTRFGSQQFLVAFLDAKEEDTAAITDRIFNKFYDVYEKNSVSLRYEVAEFSDGKE